MRKVVGVSNKIFMVVRIFKRRGLVNGNLLLKSMHVSKPFPDFECKTDHSCRARLDQWINTFLFQGKFDKDAYLHANRQVMKFYPVASKQITPIRFHFVLVNPVAKRCHEV